jgi:hypothetical protein
MKYITLRRITNIMRKIITIALILMLLVTVSIQAKFKKDLKKLEKVALVSVSSSKQIDASEFNSLGAMITKLADSEDFDLMPITVSLKESVYEVYAKELPFPLMPEEELFAIEGFSEINQLSFIISPEGYPNVMPISKKKVMNAVWNAVPDADGIMLVYASYTLNKVVEAFGFGTAKMQCNIWVEVRSRKKGKRILTKNLYGRSENKIKFQLGGVMDTTQLIPLCQEATDIANAKMVEWLQKQNAR